MHQEQITADAVLADGSTAARFARTAGALADFGRHHPTGAIGGIFLIIIMTMVLLANIISPFRYDRTVARQLLPPMSEATLDDGTLWIGTRRQLPRARTRCRQSLAARRSRVHVRRNHGPADWCRLRHGARHRKRLLRQTLRPAHSKAG